MHWFHHVHIWVVVAVCFLQRQGRSPSIHSKLPVTKQARHARWTTLQRPTFTIVWEFWSKLTSRAALKAKRKGVYSIKKKATCSILEEKKGVLSGAHTAVTVCWGAQRRSQSCCSCFPCSNSNKSPCTSWAPAAGKNRAQWDQRVHFLPGWLFKPFILENELVLKKFQIHRRLERLIQLSSTYLSPSFNN